MHARTVHNVADLVKITALTAVFRDVQTPFFNTLDLKSTEKLLYNYFFFSGRTHDASSLGCALKIFAWVFKLSSVLCYGKISILVEGRTFIHDFKASAKVNTGINTSISQTIVLLFGSHYCRRHCCCCYYCIVIIHYLRRHHFHHHSRHF